jgi:hypothetical protein
MTHTSHNTLALQSQKVRYGTYVLAKDGRVRHRYRLYNAPIAQSRAGRTGDLELV